MQLSAKCFRRSLSGALLMFSALLLPYSAQAQSSTGTLLGEVQDAKGGRVQVASVVVTRPDSSMTADHDQ